MKKLLSLALAALMLCGLAACGKKPESEPAAPSYSVVKPGDSSVSVPEPAPDPLNQAFLTGLEKGADYPEGKRITAVMVNNISGSRPTRGLTDAKIVYEIKVEGGITRFMALFEDYETMPNVGGVRSARDQFLQLLIPFRGFYVHDGPNQNQPTNWMLRDYEYEEFDLQPNTGATFRMSRPGMPSEYTEYTDGEHITKAIENMNDDPSRTYSSAIFDFVSYKEEPRVPATGTASEVAVIHSASYRSLFEYNSGTGRYDMSQFNSGNGSVQQTVDENNNEQLAFDNVIVLFAPMQLYANSELVKVDYGVGGAGYYFTKGGWELLIWRKGGPEAPLLLYQWDNEGEMVKVNPGTSYVAVVDDALLPDFDAYLQGGNADAAMDDAQVNTDETDTDD